MKSGREFNRHVMFSRRDQRPRDLNRNRKRIGRHAAGAQFETECGRFRFGIMSRQQIDRFLGGINRGFPKRLQFQITNDRSRLIQLLKIDI